MKLPMQGVGEASVHHLQPTRHHGGSQQEAVHGHGGSLAPASHGYRPPSRPRRAGLGELSVRGQIGGSDANAGNRGRARPQRRSRWRVSKGMLTGHRPVAHAEIDASTWPSRTTTHRTLGISAMQCSGPAAYLVRVAPGGAAALDHGLRHVLARLGVVYEQHRESMTRPSNATRMARNARASPLIPACLLRFQRCITRVTGVRGMKI